MEISSLEQSKEGSTEAGGGREGERDEHVAVCSSPSQLRMISGLHAGPADRHERTSGLMLHYVMPLFLLEVCVAQPAAYNI